MIARYREYRDLGMSRRRTLVALLPIRARVAYAVLRGRPVAYRLDIRNGGLHGKMDVAIVAECRISGRFW